MRIEADQLCVDYNGTVALYDASLHLPEGCICGLVGMNGAGKSTLFKALTGFVRPSQVISASTVGACVKPSGSRPCLRPPERGNRLSVPCLSLGCGDDGSLWGDESASDSSQQRSRRSPRCLAAG